MRGSDFINSPNHVFIVLNEVEENNNTIKMPDADSAKLKHKNAWTELNKTVQRVAKKLSTNVYIKPSRWSMGQYLYKRFWFELKKEDRKDSNSSVSLSFDKSSLKIYLEWDRKNVEKSSNTLEEHNYWLNFLHDWTNKSNIDLDKYFVWITNDEDKDKPEPIKLRGFLEDEMSSNKQIQQQLRNPTYPFRVGQILPKEEIDETNTFVQHLLLSLEELFAIYDNTTPIIEEKFVFTETEKEQIIKSRIGQAEFKKSLLKHEKKCQLCGVMDVRFLIASHIKPWSNSNSGERLDSDNGLLLCPNHDALFDKGYISFDDTGKILISLSIDSNLKLFLNINEQIQLHMNESQKKYMKWHRENLFSLK